MSKESRGRNSQEANAGLPVEDSRPGTAMISSLVVVATASAVVVSLHASSFHEPVSQWALSFPPLYRELALTAGAGLTMSCLVLATLTHVRCRARRIHASLTSSEARFRALVEATSDWIWEMGPDARYTFVGARAHAILGYSPQELLGKRPDMLLHPDEWQRVKREFAPYVRRGVAFPPTEVEAVHKSGRVVYLESTGLPIVDRKGTLHGYRGIDRDITARKLAQEALRYSEMRLAEAQAVAHLGSGEWDVERGHFTWSRGMYRIFELSPTTAQPSFAHYVRLVPPDARRGLFRFCAQVRMGKQPLRYEHALVFPNGLEKTVQVRIRSVVGPTGKPTRVFCTLQDVTEQKQSERRLRESEQRLWAAVEHMPNLFHAFDDSGVFLAWNREWELVSGYSKETMIGNSHGLALLFPDETQRNAFWAEWRSGLPREAGAWEIRRADGSMRMVVWSNIAVEFPIAGWASWGIGKDVTERRRVDAERKLLMMAIEQAVESVVVADTNGRIQYANPAFELCTGYCRDDVLNTKPHFLRSFESGENILSSIAARVREGGIWQGRLETDRKDGSTFFEEVTVFPVKDGSGAITNYVKLGRDVTHEIQLQAQSQRRQKLEALGTLAGGVAHDFNNLLMPIMGFSELLLGRLAADDPNRPYLREILTASERARDIARQMLMFSRQGPAECEPVRLGNAAREALRLLRASIPSTVAIAEDIRVEHEFVWADPTQIHQILMNICTNAYQAMREGGGEIRVLVDRVCATSAMASLYPPLRDRASYLRISIADNGCGMDEDTVTRIFDPFYTTKPVGQGTGLGLATVHGIVTGLRGAIHVESEIGHGSEFVIYLPEHVVQSRAGRDATASAPVGRGERILIVDDEPAVLSATQQMVADLGYEATPACGSEVALTEVLAHPDAYDLLLTDQTMPSMTGAQLAAEIRQIRQDLPIVLATGFNESILPECVHEIGLQKVLRKPYTRQELAQVLHDALGV